MRSPSGFWGISNVSKSDFAFTDNGEIGVEIFEHVVPVWVPDNDTCQGFVECLEVGVRGFHVGTHRHAPSDGRDRGLGFFRQQEVNELLAGIAVRRTLYETNIVWQREGRPLSVRTGGPERSIQR